ncbi:MAG TPA: hypothetical protein VHM19_00295, partial [Polyangiales bacterium]|nr:hypothetical protein [Polyangiales bacterium]
HAARIAPLTWAALITGAVVLGVGVGMGASAHGSFSDLKATPVRTAADARRVHSDFDSIETRATVANVMMPLGGAVLGVGAVLLVLDLTKHQPNDERDSEARIDVVPLRGGGALTFRSALGAW